MNKNSFFCFNTWQVIMPITTAVTVVASFCNYAQAVTFNFFPTEGTSQEVLDAFTIAGDLWSSHLQDDVTINIGIGFETLPENIIGGANPDMVRVKYKDVINQLIQDQTSSDDAQGINYLPTAINGGINRLISNTGDWFGLSHVDDGIRDVWMTSANAKALGIIDGNSSNIDGFITLSDTFNWDFNRDNDIKIDAFDIISTATHEIGHLLGFASGADILDMVSANLSETVFSQGEQITDQDYNFISTMDLYRHSSATEEINQFGNYVIDWRTDFTWLEELLGINQTYFSLDGGQTKIANFAKGLSQDGYQTSHFQENSVAVMAPTLQPGEIKNISPLDLQLLDVIGWDTQILANTDYKDGLAQYLPAFVGELYRLSWGRGSSGSRGHSFRQMADYDFSYTESDATATVPEPSIAIGLLGLSLWGIRSMSKKNIALRAREQGTGNREQ